MDSMLREWVRRSGYAPRVRAPEWVGTVNSKKEADHRARNYFISSLRSPAEPPFVILLDHQGRDARHRDDVGGGRATGEVVARPGEALQDRADRLGAGQVLHELVGDVRGLEVREDEDVRPPRDG